jgi:hypothetical protein
MRDDVSRWVVRFATSLRARHARRRRARVSRVAIRAIERPSARRARARARAIDGGARDARERESG